MSRIIARLVLFMGLFASSGAVFSETVMTVGDSLSEGYGMVLPKWLHGSGWNAVNAGRRSSGLVSKKPFDWLSSMPGLMGRYRPDVVLMSFGANDAGMNLMKDGKSLRFGSEEWALEYSMRMYSVIAEARKMGSFVIWMPIPRFSDETRERNAVWLRSLQERVAYSGGALVPDVAGIQTSRYKQSDGIHYNGLGYSSAVDKAFKDAWATRGVR